MKNPLQVRWSIDKDALHTVRGNIVLWSLVQIGVSLCLYQFMRTRVDIFSTSNFLFNVLKWVPLGIAGLSLFILFRSTLGQAFELAQIAEGKGGLFKKPEDFKAAVKNNDKSFRIAEAVAAALTTDKALSIMDRNYPYIETFFVLFSLVFFDRYGDAFIFILTMAIVILCHIAKRDIVRSYYQAVEVSYIPITGNCSITKI